MGYFQVVNYDRRGFIRLATAELILTWVRLAKFLGFGENIVLMFSILKKLSSFRLPNIQHSGADATRVSTTAATTTTPTSKATATTAATWTTAARRESKFSRKSGPTNIFFVQANRRFFESSFSHFFAQKWWLDKNFGKEGWSGLDLQTKFHPHHGGRSSRSRPRRSGPVWNSSVCCDRQLWQGWVDLPEEKVPRSHEVVGLCQRSLRRLKSSLIN